MTTNIKAILFDVDDTIFDRGGAQRKALRLIVREFHDIFAGIDKQTIVDAFLESDRLAMEKFYAGGSFEETRAARGKEFLKLLGLSEDFADKITEMYVKSYPTIDAPVKGAKSVIIKLAGRFQLGVVSDGFPDTQYRKLRTLGIEDLVDCIVLAGEIGIRKPDPGIFWKAAELLARKPEECLYVGDFYEADVLGAKKAGMQACWFNPDGLRPSTEVKPDFEISELDEILEILER
jgi:HAD superfamily hydrolase (TIGR01509 family)